MTVHFSTNQRWMAVAGLGVLALVCGCQPSTTDTVATEAEPEPLTGEYLGQQPPGLEPVLFAPGIVSTGLSERDMAITPDGEELYFTASLGARSNFSAILVVRQVDGRWRDPEVAAFSGQYADLEPALSPDGRRLFFVSRRPLPGSSEQLESEDIWATDRQAGGWGEPYNLGEPINSPEAEFFPSITQDNTIYFTRQGEGRTEAIYRARWLDGTYQEPERLPDVVNAAPTQFNAFIAPDESYLIVCSYGREDSLGGVDYYVVFRTPEDEWSGPFNLGDRINTAEGQEWSPYVSPDGKYLFFMSSRATIENRYSPTRLRQSDLQRIHREPMNGNSDIWWVDARIIEELRPAN